MLETSFITVSSSDAGGSAAKRDVHVARRLGFNRCGVSCTVLAFFGRPRVRGWHVQHFVQLVPASHLSHTGFLCVLEQASDMISDYNDVTVMVWELVVGSEFVVLCANRAYPEHKIAVLCI